MFSSKNVSFSNVYAFLSKKIATFKKSYEVGIKGRSKPVQHFIQHHVFAMLDEMLE